MASRAHAGQSRASGEPYITHPVAVAEIVAQWGLDEEAVVAALLHDVVEDTDTTLAKLELEFGPKVAELVDGLTKMRLSASPRPAADSVRLEASNENLRKLLLATGRDPRVILIKLADRLHNMRTLGYLEAEKRVMIARESLEIYAPLADRLGMGQLKAELEDLGFKFTSPAEFEELRKLVQTTIMKAGQHLSGARRAIYGHLRQAGVDVIKIEGRPKHLFSIRKKLVKTGGDIEKIYDLIAVRVIVPDVSACYQALGILHMHYRPLIYRIKDYIAVPKPNGYQSLHTTVFAEGGHITEIQIRTPEMHEAAERGLAAHFFYNTHKSTGAYAKGEGPGALPESQSWVNNLADLQKALSSGGDLAEGAKLELFGDRIFVFSPKGDLYDLPEGATPLDFAFIVHSSIGLRALGARVNGRMVPLDTKLGNRDVVEIITRKEPAPSRDWLGVVATHHAKSRIRAWFRAVGRDEKIVTGRAALEAELSTWGVKRLDMMPKRAILEAAKGLGLRSADEMFAQVGEGSLALSTVIRKLIPDAAKPKGTAVVKRQEPTGRITVEGTTLPYSLAACCNPVFPQPLLGYVTRGKGVTVHALGCRNVPSDAERYTKCRWETQAGAPELIVCRVEVEATDRIGMISDIAAQVAKMRLNIGNFKSARTGVEERTIVSFDVEVADLFALARLMRRLERVPGVLAVNRV
jgi:guanosine-3',5'-bis(diphosphate) 3'-pyrophosphohydrolase